VRRGLHKMKLLTKIISLDDVDRHILNRLMRDETEEKTLHQVSRKPDTDCLRRPLAPIIKKSKNNLLMEITTVNSTGATTNCEYCPSEQKLQLKASSTLIKVIHTSREKCIPAISD
jgi:hypothetical protein